MCTSNATASPTPSAVNGVGASAKQLTTASGSARPAALACIAQAIASADAGVDVVDAAAPAHPLAPSNAVSISHCQDPDGCVTLADILKCFNAAVSEEQAWALIYQSVRLYRDALHSASVMAEPALHESHVSGRGMAARSAKHPHWPDTRLPNTLRNFNLHKDGSVHMSFNARGEYLLIFFFVFRVMLSYARLGLSCRRGAGDCAMCIACSLRLCGQEVMTSARFLSLSLSVSLSPVDLNVVAKKKPSTCFLVDFNGW